MELKERKLFKCIKEHLNNKECSIIIGARQTGKSTILRQLQLYLEKENKKVISITLEDPLILNELNKHPENIFKFVKKPVDAKKIYVLVDEIQYLNAPTNFLKLLFDKYSDALKIVATGSSAFYMDNKFKDSLYGRKKIFELYTLDFEEYLDFKNADHEMVEELRFIRNDNNYISLKRKEINNYFDDYLSFGGYPAVVLKDNELEKTDTLKELFLSYLKKDALEAGIQYHDKFYNLLVIIAHQSGSLLNINELSNTLGMSVTAVSNYIYVLRKSFHIQLVPPFFNNIRKELTKMPKIYFNDLGLRNIIMNYFNPIMQRADKGTVIENYIYIRLRQLYGHENIRFWRTTSGAEIDFIYNSGKIKSGIEAKFNANEFKPSKYTKFTESYPDISINCKAYLSKNNEKNIIGL